MLPDGLGGGYRQRGSPGAHVQAAGTLLIPFPPPPCPQGFISTGIIPAWSPQPCSGPPFLGCHVSVT